jgi:hypothetical protein
MNSKPYLVWATGIAAIAVILVAVWMAIASTRFEPVGAEGLPGKFGGRIMAMEFISTAPDLAKILGPTVSQNTEVMKKVLSIDFVWIGCYGALFVLTGALLSRRNCPWAKYLALLAIVTGLAAAAFDVRENLKILELLASQSVTQEQVNGVRDAALTKWTLSFFSIAVLAIAFMDLGNKLGFWISTTFIITATVGLFGLWNHNLLALIPIPLVVALVILSITAFGWPNKLTEQRC